MLRKGQPKNGLIILINGSFFCVHVCYVRGTEVSLPGQEGILEMRTVGKDPTRYTENRAQDPSGCIATTHRAELDTNNG